MVLKEFPFRGIKKIMIPVSDSDLKDSADNGLSIIVHYLRSKCMSDHRANADKIKYLHEFFLGEQDIKSKTRPYDGNKANNNCDVENHCMAQVNFKTDFLCGEKRKFTNKTSNESNEITYLERYLTDSGFYSKDKNCKEWIYSTGIGVTLTSPRTDIIDREKGTYTANNYDSENEAPFIFETVRPEFNFVVYSSKSGHEPLFCVTLSREADLSSKNFSEKDVIEVCTRYHYWKLVRSNYNVIKELALAFTELPLIEHSINEARIGLTEINRDEYHLVNLLISNSADAIVDTANQIIVFENVNISEEQMNEMIAAGAILVKSDVSQSAGANSKKIYTLSVSFNHQDLNVFYEQRCTKMYDIAGVPLASGTVTSGGDTAQARLLGGGWNNAYTRIKGDIIGLQNSDYAQLKLILKICKLVPGSRLENLAASQVEIKYSINPNDNIQAKAQSAVYLKNIGMPTEMVLEKTGLSMDVHADGKMWQDAIDKNTEKTAQEPKPPVNQ